MGLASRIQGGLPAQADRVDINGDDVWVNGVKVASIRFGTPPREREIFATRLLGKSYGQYTQTYAQRT